MTQVETFRSFREVVRSLSLLAAAALAGGCTLSLTYPLASVESSALACADGIDNDQDGFADCDDDSCACNRCGDVVEPVADELGRLCERDCECLGGEVCNPTVSRCIGAPTPDENAFEVFFVEEVDEAGAVVSGPRQNVAGHVRFNGASYELSTMDTSTCQTVFGGAETAGRRPRLRLGHFPLPRPDETTRAAYELDDGLGATEYGQIADFSFLPPTASPLEQRLNILAIVRTSVLTYEPRATTAAGFWAGHVVGVLREATSYHRAAGNGCEDEEIYHPDTGRCQPFRPQHLSTRELFLFGCAFTPDAPPVEAGGAVFLRRPRSSADEFGTKGRCAAAREGDRVRVVMTGGVSFSFAIEILIPSSRLVGKLRVPLPETPGPDDFVATMNRLPADDTYRSLLDAVLEGPTRRIAPGVMAIEAVSEGDTGVLIGWIEAEEPQ